MDQSETCPSCDAPWWTHPPQSVMCEMLHKMQKDNLALREMVGKMEGILRLQKDVALASDMFGVISDLYSSARYWSEYEVPIGIVERMKKVLEAVNE